MRLRLIAIYLFFYFLLLNYFIPNIEGHDLYGNEIFLEFFIGITLIIGLMSATVIWLSVIFFGEKIISKWETAELEFINRISVMSNMLSAILVIKKVILSGESFKSPAILYLFTVTLPIVSFLILVEILIEQKIQKNVKIS